MECALSQKKEESLLNSSNVSFPLFPDDQMTHGKKVLEKKLALFFFSSANWPHNDATIQAWHLFYWINRQQDSSPLHLQFITREKAFSRLRRRAPCNWSLSYFSLILSPHQLSPWVELPCLKCTKTYLFCTNHVFLSYPERKCSSLYTYMDLVDYSEDHKNMDHYYS